MPERTQPGRSIDPLLRTALRRPATPASADCLDAETLAAWSDGTLPGDRSRQIEAHVADCARCRMVMATFARTQPVAPAVLPFWRRSSVRWLVPLAAAASVAIWIAWPGRKAEAPSSAIARVEPSSAPVEAKPFADKNADAPRDAQANAPSSAGSASDQVSSARSGPAKALRQKSIEREETAKADSSLKRQQSAGALQEPRNEVSKSVDADALTLNKNQTIDGIPQAPNATPMEAPRELPLPSARPAPAPAPASPTASPSPTQTAIAAALARPSGVAFEVVAQDSVARRDTAAVPGSGARGGAAGRPVNLSASATSARNRWRVIASGNVERTIDGGQSWAPIAIDPPVTLTAGSAPSSLVCWLVGPQGVVLVTTDGVHFVRVSFPESTDLVSIAAVDAQHAAVTTADGRAFTTADGGVSWRPGRD